jgi:predicted RNA binding protein YcfA (HicA-like mRNA interferase family)
VTKFPRDAPIAKVLKALGALGFEVIREGNHISLSRINADGSRTPLTMPNHKEIKSSTLLLILRQAGITRDEFIEVFNKL